MSKQHDSASTSQQDDHALSVKDLTQGNLLGHLYRLALPIMGTSFVQMAYSFTDMAWLGRLSSEAVAAVGTISVFLWIAQSVAYFNKTGSEVTIGQSIGRKALDEARLYASHNTTLSIGISILLAVGYCLLAPVLVDLYRPSQEVGTLALEYMYVVLWGLPASFLTFTLFGIYNATGNSSVPFRILSLGLVCNIVLDPILIHLLGWGVSGAAWATIISQYLVLGLFLYRLRVHDRLLSGFPLIVHLSWKPSWRIITIGLPAASLNVLFAIVAIYMGRLASTAGGHIGIAVLTTGGQLEALTWNTAQGATTALGTIVAQNYAAGLLPRLWRAYRLAMTFTLSVGALGMLYFVLMGEDLFALIVPDPATYQAGGAYMRISGYSQIFMMAEITTQGLFYGMGRSYLPAIISIVGNVLRIPLALGLIALGWGLEGVWWAISLSSILKGAMAVVAFAIVRARFKSA